MDGGPFKNDDFEVKWGVHPKGDKKDIAGMNIKAKTLSILIKGKFLVSFPDDGEEVILGNQGDYVYFENGIYHGSEALEDSVVLTIRWPSIGGDQVKK